MKCSTDIEDETTVILDYIERMSLLSTYSTPQF